MGRYQQMDFDARAWLTDPKLSRCKASTRGIWVDAICAMHELDRCGRLLGSVEELSRICRCRADEMRAALLDLHKTEAADLEVKLSESEPNHAIVTFQNGEKTAFQDALITDKFAIITLTNRRQRREWEARQLANNRALKYRERKTANAKAERVTRKSRSPSLSISLLGNNLSDCSNASGGGCNGITPEAFQAFWNAYPAHRRMSETLVFDALMRIHADASLLSRMVDALQTLKASDSWRDKGGQFVPNMLRWIEAHGWEAVSVEQDEPPPEPAGSDPAPPKGMRWKRDGKGELVHPLTAEPK